MEWIYHTVRHFLIAWGYWAILIGLLGESSGIPLPGETVLMFAAFLAHKKTGLHIEWVILTGICAAVMGDNIGFLLGRHFGKTLIRWARKLLRLDDTDLKAAKTLIRRRGGRTIFFSRFIFGLRTIAGPLAGSLGMEWRDFFLYNLMGGATWVVAISLSGFAFANEFNTLLGYIEKASWGIAGGLLLFGYLMWRRQKKRYKQRHARQRSENAA
ncbi:MAG TPA: DedA family protein [Terriglobales bacterium]|nr:DedA family protein [Terriglobales bacterium]